MSDPLKRCSKCQTEKPREAFHKAPKRKDGLYPYCRDCKNAWKREYRKANPEKMRQADRAKHARRSPDEKRASAKRYRDANLEQARESNRRYYERNREAIIQRTKRWHAENADLSRELKRAHREANRDKYRNKINSRRARISGTAIGPVDLESLWTGLCGICGEGIDRAMKFPNPLSPSVDHIIPLSKGGGHVADNLQWAHFGCNASKSNRV